MTAEEVLKMWKHKAPKGAREFFIIDGRAALGWFVLKDSHMACRESGIIEYEYQGGLKHLKDVCAERNWSYKVINLFPTSLENK